MGVQDKAKPALNTVHCCTFRQPRAAKHCSTIGQLVTGEMWLSVYPEGVDTVDAVEL